MYMYHGGLVGGDRSGVGSSSGGHSQSHSYVYVALIGLIGNQLYHKHINIYMFMIKLVWLVWPHGPGNLSRSLLPCTKFVQQILSIDVNKIPF